MTPRLRNNYMTQDDDVTKTTTIKSNDTRLARACSTIDLLDLRLLLTRSCSFDSRSNFACSRSLSTLSILARISNFHSRLTQLSLIFEILACFHLLDVHSFLSRLPALDSHDARLARLHTLIFHFTEQILFHVIYFTFFTQGNIFSFQT